MSFTEQAREQLRDTVISNIRAFIKQDKDFDELFYSRITISQKLISEKEYLEGTTFIRMGVRQKGHKDYDIGFKKIKGLGDYSCFLEPEDEVSATFIRDA